MKMYSSGSVEKLTKILLGRSKIGLLLLIIASSVSSGRGSAIPKCPECLVECKDIVNCVLCTLNGTTELADQEACQFECQKYPTVHYADEFNSSFSDTSFTGIDSTKHLCSHLDPLDLCSFNFSFEVSTTSGTVNSIIADRLKSCPPDPKLIYPPAILQANSSMSRYIFGAICGLVLCVLLVLCLGIFKLLNTKCTCK